MKPEAVDAASPRGEEPSDMGKPTAPMSGSLRTDAALLEALHASDHF